MPTYSYKCTKCDEEGEGIFKNLESFAEQKCGKCGSDVEQIYSPTNFKINGYSHNNEYKGKSMYRDIGQKDRKSTTYSY